jgi:hypothetical protein
LLVAKAAKTAERGPNYAPTDPPRGAQAAHVLGSLAPSVLIPPVIENAGIVESLVLAGLDAAHVRIDLRIEVHRRGGQKTILTKILAPSGNASDAVNSLDTS